MARIKVDHRGFGYTPAADAFKEIQRVGNPVDDALIGVLQRRMLNKPDVPILGVVQVSKPAVDECTYEIQREGRTLVAPQK